MKVRSFWHLSRIAYFMWDYVVLLGCVILACRFSPRFEGEVLWGVFFTPGLRLIGYGLPLFMSAGLHLADVQRTEAGFRGPECLTRTTIGIGGGILTFALVHAIFEFSLVGRWILLQAFVFGTITIVISRFLLWSKADRERRRSIFYGNAEAIEEIRRDLMVARMPIDLLIAPDLTGDGSSVKACPNDGRLLLAARAAETDEILVYAPRFMGEAERRELLACTRAGLRVIDIGIFYERELERVYTHGLDGTWFWGYDPVHDRPVFFAFKRVSDVVFSSVGLILLAPLFPVIAIAIRLQDGGPVMYSQARLGRGGNAFKILKFRTMRLDAEASGAQWAAKHDNRVTIVGKILRKTRLDETPQFWNILKGDMSFVGPRPERPEFVSLIEQNVPFYTFRHIIKPGLTGWAQVNYPYGASVEDARRKLSYDLYYLKYASIRRELHIILKTLVAAAKGAR